MTKALELESQYEQYLQQMEVANNANKDKAKAAREAQKAAQDEEGENEVPTDEAVGQDMNLGL